MATDHQDKAQALLSVAQKRARFDHERMREHLLRMRHDWCLIDPELKDGADKLIEMFDGFGLRIQQVKL